VEKFIIIHFENNLISIPLSNRIDISHSILCLKDDIFKLKISFYINEIHAVDVTKKLLNVKKNEFNNDMREQFIKKITEVFNKEYISFVSDFTKNILNIDKDFLNQLTNFIDIN